MSIPFLDILMELSPGYVAQVLEHFPDWQQWEREAYPQKNEVGYLYAVGCDRVDIVKLGWSECPWQRCQQVRQSAARCIGGHWQLLGLKACTHWDEVKLHDALAEYRASVPSGIDAPNEWYHQQGLVIDIVASLAAELERLRAA